MLIFMEASIDFTFVNIKIISKRGKKKIIQKPNNSVFDRISAPLRQQFLLVFGIISGSL